MADLSQITLPSGTTYNLKDAKARQDISDIKTELSGAMSFVGTTTTALTDGATTSPIKVDNVDYTPSAGDVVAYGDKEFAFGKNGKWIEFGDLGSLKALAFKDSASGTFKPAGSVSQPTFSGTKATISVKGTPEGTVSKPTFSGTKATISMSGTPSGSVAISKGTGTANYTPEGSVSQPTFTGTSASFTVSGGSGTATYTPAGSVSQPTFTGSATTSTGKFKPAGTIAISKASSGTANYTPQGSVSTPTITVTPNTTTVNSITAVGTLPSWTATVTDENLTLGWDAGTLPTKGSNTTVATGIKSATSSQPTFTGTGAVLTATFTGTEGDVSVSGTPSGTVSKPTFSGTGTRLTGSVTATGSVSQPTFTGTGVELKGTFTGSSLSMTTDYTPAGSVSQPTFTGSELTSSGDYTPAGTVSKPTFSGTSATVTVS